MKAQPRARSCQEIAVPGEGERRGEGGSGSGTVVAPGTRADTGMQSVAGVSAVAELQ